MRTGVYTILLTLPTWWQELHCSVPLTRSGPHSHTASHCQTVLSLNRPGHRTNVPPLCARFHPPLWQSVAAAMFHSRHLHLSFPLHRQSSPDPKVGIVPAPMLTSNRIYATGAPKPKPYGVTGEGSGSISPACSRLDAAYNSGECGGRNAPQLRATAGWTKQAHQVIRTRMAAASLGPRARTSASSCNTTVGGPSNGP